MIMEFHWGCVGLPGYRDVIISPEFQIGLEFYTSGDTEKRYYAPSGSGSYITVYKDSEFCFYGMLHNIF